MRSTAEEKIIVEAAPAQIANRIPMALVEQIIRNEPHQIAPAIERRRRGKIFEERFPLRRRIPGAVEDRLDLRHIRTIRLCQCQSCNSGRPIELTSVRV